MCSWKFPVSLVLDICAWHFQDSKDSKCGFFRGLGGSAGLGVQMRVKPAKCGSLGRYATVRFYSVVLNLGLEVSIMVI